MVRQNISLDQILLFMMLRNFQSQFSFQHLFHLTVIQCDMDGLDLLFTQLFFFFFPQQQLNLAYFRIVASVKSQYNFSIIIDWVRCSSSCLIVSCALSLSSFHWVQLLTSVGYKYCMAEMCSSYHCYAIQSFFSIYPPVTGHQPCQAVY